MNPNQKTELLRAYLEGKGAYVPDGMGKRKVRCFFPERHARGDRRPSAEIDLTKGRYTCYACNLRGDVFDIAKELDGLTYSECLTTVSGGKPLRDVARRSEPTWL